MSLSRRAFVVLGIAASISACSAAGTIAPSGSTPPSALSVGTITALINATRKANGKQALTYSSTLARAARTHANLMASRNKMSHTLGGSLRERVTAAGYTGAVGENLADGYKTLESAIAGWLKSPGHRSTLLSPNFVEFGLAASRSAKGKTYWAFIAGGDYAAWRPKGR